LLLLSAGVAFSIAVFKTAGALENHRQKTFCLVVAWIACALFPLGTVLGVFTILQLIQYEADRAFSEEENPYFTMEDFRDPSK
jgi:ABC-type lipoprotein release transport system permease subunit